MTFSKIDMTGRLLGKTCNVAEKPTVLAP